MAFTIYTSSEKVTWNIPSPKPKDMFRIGELQAYGYELEMIRTQFENIPITKGNICKWKGEMANFIFENLR